MSYRRCSAYWEHPDDRCWRVVGHRDEHRYAPLANVYAELAAKQDLMISVELQRLVVSNDVIREHAKPQRLQEK